MRQPCIHAIGLFDAHTRAFTAFDGVTRRGIYANMQTAE